MGYNLEFNCLLRIPKDTLDLTTLKVGEHYTITKTGDRLYPVNIAIEICDDQYVYYGKVAVRKLTLDGTNTVLDIEVLKIFDATERDVYTRTFIKS